MSGDVFDFDFSRLSETQIEVLCNVAFGGHGGGCGARILKSLEARGLIEPEQVTEPTGMGTFVYTRWEMPLHVHVAFCAWCARVESVEREG